MVHADWASACARDGMTAMNRRDWSAFDSLYAPNVIYETPHGPTILGLDALRRHLEEFVSVVPDHHESDLRMIQNDAECGWATFSFVESGTFRGSFPKPGEVACGEGSRFAVHSTAFVRFDDDGRVARLRTAHS